MSRRNPAVTAVRGRPPATPTGLIPLVLLAAALPGGCDDPVEPEERTPSDAVLWSQALPGSTSSPGSEVPVQPYADDRVAIHFDATGRARAFEAKTGEPLWERNLPLDTGSDLLADPAPWTRAVGASGRIVVPGSELVALDRDTGEIDWRWIPAELELELATNALAAANGRVFAGTGEGRLFALDAATGEVLWESDLEERPFGLLPSGGILYLGSRAYGDPADRSAPVGRVRAVALDPDSGEEIWSFSAPEPPEEGTDATTLHNVSSMAPGAVSEGVFVISGRNGSFYGLDGSDGSLLWTAEPGTGLEAGATGFGSLVLLTGAFEAVAAIGVTDGSVRWRREGEGGTRFPAAAGENLAFATPAGIITAVDESGERRWFHPQPFETAPVHQGGIVYGGVVDANLREEFVALPAEP